MSEKIQKVMAAMGMGSRRQIEQWIVDGRIAVNDQPATLGDRVEAKDIIKLDGKVIKRVAKTDQLARVIMYNKNEGEVCSRNDPEGRLSVYERLPKLRGERWVMVGRLDINTTGLLLFTTDGELANRLMHPSHQIEREYIVRVRGDVTEEMLRTLKKGVMLEDGMAHFTSITKGQVQSTNAWFAVTLLEGRNREVRRLWESQGVTVSRLKRIRYGAVSLPAAVSRGRWKDLDEKSIKTLYRAVHLPLPNTYDGIATKATPEAERKFGRTAPGPNKRSDVQQDDVEKSTVRPKKASGRPFKQSSDHELKRSENTRTQRAGTLKNRTEKGFTLVDKPTGAKKSTARKVPNKNKKSR